MNLASCAFSGGDHGLTLLAGAVIRANKCTFSRHKSSGISVGTMSEATVTACCANDCVVGIAADGCEQLKVVGGEALRCHVGKYFGIRN
jgi:hypothetical protein